MYIQSLWNKLFRFLDNRSGDSLNSISAVSEQNRLIHRLNCIKLDDEEAKCLNAYLTTVLEARSLQSTSELTTTEKSDCIVLEMGEEELQNFSQVLGAHGLRTFRVIVESDDSQTQARKLMVIGEHGLRLFQVHVQSSARSSFAETTTT